MIHYNKNLQEKLPINIKELYVVADFDKTLTQSDSRTTWAILADTGLMPEEYKKDRYELYNTYRPIEVDNTIDEKIKFEKMQEWFEKHLELFAKYKLKESTLKQTAEDKDIMQLRKGVKEFLEFLHENNVPLIIISAGIGNYIEYYLENNNCYFSNIYIISNMIEFRDDVAVRIKKIIHSLNKNEAALTEEILETIKDKKQILLLGDQIADTKMVSENKRNQTVRVGFLNEDTKNDIEIYKKYFDIVCEEDTSYNELQKLLLK